MTTTEHYSLLHGDCLECMEEIADEAVDLILTDLPYGTTSQKWDKIIPFDKLWLAYRRIIKKNGAIVLFGTEPFMATLICSNLEQFKYTWKWNKIKPSGFLNAKNAPMKCIEQIAVFSTGTIANGSQERMPYNPQGLVTCGKTRPPKNKSIPDGSTTGRRPSRENSYTQEFTNFPRDLIEFPFESKPIHPTQKPVSLLEYLILTYTSQGQVVLDSTMGSGSTGIAALNTGRYFIGIEKEANFYEMARTRMELHFKSCRLYKQELY